MRKKLFLKKREHFDRQLNGKVESNLKEKFVLLDNNFPIF